MVFCNFEKDITYPKNIWVTILILIDGFLQCVHNMSINIEQICHNPYFNRWFSAILIIANICDLMNVTILILIDGFLQY